MKTILCALIVICTPGLTKAQFSSQGKITYERKVNLKMKYQTEEGYEWIKGRIDQVAPFKVSVFNMVFNKEQSNYTFEKDIEITKGSTFSWGKDPASENKILSNYTTKKVLAEKEIFEDTYLVEDSLRKYTWKIEDEVRIIAGYPCRKAVTKIYDSVVVVAFYSDQLMVSGGPESFNGLPGMILGLAIPRLFTTWFATNVDILPQEPRKFTPIKKSKKVNNDQLVNIIKKGTDRWGQYGVKLLWKVSL